MKRLAVLLLSLCAVTAAAQQFDNQARGFAPGKPFQYNGLDNVNIFNGNLTVAIPVGPTYTVNGGLSYSFSLIYSGNVWDVVKSGFNQQTTTIVPNRRSNAGLGWLFSLGRIIAPTDPTNEIFQQDTNINDRVWIYESPDGGDHVLYPTLHGTGAADGIHTYSRDSTYIRMTKVTDTTRNIEFPDGTYHVFKELDQNFGTPWTETLSPGFGTWKLVEMRDRFGNSVSIQYTTDATWAEKWTITDGARTHTAYFKPATSPYTVLFDHVDLAAFNGATATWALTAPYYDVQRGPGDNSNNGLASTVPWHVPLVTRLTAPAIGGVSATYDMTLSASPDYDVTGSTSGHLRGIQLPTRGWLEWDYQYITLSGGALPRSRDRAIGVVTRRTLDANRNTIGTWIYGHRLSDRNSCLTDPGVQSQSNSSQLVASVTSPEGTTSVNYFNVYTDGETICPGDVGDSVTYGMPLSPGVQDADGRSLSEEIRTGTVSLVTGPSNYRVSGGTPIQSTYLKYDLELDAQLQFYATNDRNSRVTSTAVVYDGDAGCSGTCRMTTENLSFDGFGHFRQTSGAGNFTGSAYRTIFANYDGALDSAGDWVLNTLTEKCVADEPSPRTTAVSACSSLNNPFVVKLQYERSTGFLSGRRALFLRSGALSQNDLLATFSHESHGYTDHEKYYGGDVQPPQLDTVNAFTPITLPKYQIDHTLTFTSGTLTKHQAAYAGSGYFILDDDYDRWTGLLSASRDRSGVQTQYEFDPRGRSTWLKPSGRAYTGFTYTEALGSVPAQQLAVQYPAGMTSGTELTRMLSVFDGHGRLVKQQRRMPDGTDATVVTNYTPSGWTSSVSSAESTDPPTHATTYAYDALGRRISSTAPDGHVTTTSYEESGVVNNGVRSVKRTVGTGRTIQSDGSVTESNSSVIELYDDKGRLQSVTESSGPSGAAVKTSYAYDAFDHTIAVCADDQNISCGQVRNFVYDGRGLLSSEIHPENGFISYTYDPRGRVLTTRLQSPSKFDTNYTYDGAERLTRVDARNPNNLSVFQTFKEFTFWGANAAGHSRLAKPLTSVRHNYQGTADIQVTESFDYDTVGRTTSKITSIVDPVNSTGPFTQFYSYDDLSEITTLTYPTCSNCGSSSLPVVSPTYANTLMTSVPGFATNIAYAPSGMAREVSHVGSITDVITPDASGMPRPQQIQFSYDSCARPGIAQNPADAQVNSGGSATLTVAATTTSTPPLTIQWLKDGVVIPGQSGLSLNTGPLTATAHFWARIINSCGKVDSAAATVTVCGTPTITAQPQGATIASGGTWGMSVTATGCGPFTYAWYRGNTGDVSSGVLGTSQSFTTPSLTVTTRYWVRVANGSGSTDSATAVVMVPLQTPGAFTASRTGTNEITVSWSASPNADHYELSRLANGFWSTFTVPQTAFVDSGRTPGVTYVYHVRAVDATGGSASPYSNNELATNMTFATVQTGGLVFFSQFDEIRTAINAVFAASGQGALTWAQMLANAGYGAVPAPAIGGPIRAAHILALRYEMDQALLAVAVARPAYTDNPPSVIRAVHITELQSRAQ